MIEFRDETFRFRARRPAASRLTSSLPRDTVNAPSHRQGFTIIMRLALAGPVTEPVTLVELRDAVRIALRPAGGAAEPGRSIDAAQNYLAFPDADGAVPVLEAALTLHSKWHPEWRDLRIGFPLALVTDRAAEHAVVFHTDGVRMHLYLDGRLMDENFLYGYPLWEALDAWTLDPARVASADLHIPALKPVRRSARRVSPVAMQYATPSGYNVYFGDLVPFFHDGRFHLFYLVDRRHHGSKFGTGAHYYGHFSTTDLRHWTEHEPAIEIEEQWETCGTGTPFFHNGRYYFAYGLHTDRFTPRTENINQVMLDHLALYGRTGVFAMAEQPGYPEGMTYAVSDNGIHFTKSRQLTHTLENPSVYTRDDNSLMLIERGVWRADDIGSGFTPVRSDFPPYGPASAMRHTLECPSFFEWNGHCYLLVGLTGMYASVSPDFAEYTDLALQGTDIYEGLAVPMVAPFGDNRRIMAGWLSRFGSQVVFRELVQFPDKTLGLKWCPETMPETAVPERLAAHLDAAALRGAGRRFALRAPHSVQLAMRVSPAGDGGRLALRFFPAAAGAGEACELQLDMDRRRAQWAGCADAAAFSTPLPTIREVLHARRDTVGYPRELGRNGPTNCHFDTVDFCIENLRQVDAPFQLRVIIWHDPKMRVTLLDAEIAGVRTMISFRRELVVGAFALAAERGVAVSDLDQAAFL